MSYVVKLEVFEGPFDLLLQLISRRQLDIAEVDLAEMTADFLTHLGEHLDQFDLETATRFLVVAATLVELKAARLLPVEERDELDDLLGQARDLLYARLLEYRAFRDASRVLAHRLEHHDGNRARDVAPEGWVRRLVPDTPLPVDAQGLAAIAAAITTPKPPPDVDLSHIRRSYLTIRDAAMIVLDALPAQGQRRPFHDLAADRSRGDRVVLFLALLELFKLGHVDLAQGAYDGPLDVERRDGGIDLDSITDPEDDHGDQADDADGQADDVDGQANDAVRREEVSTS